MAVDPLSQYAVDKYATERSILNYSRLYNMPMVCGRFFNVYGPKQNPKSPYSGVLSIVLEKLNTDSTFTLFGDGSQTRDFVFVGDVVNAIIGLLTHSDSNGNVFNIANGVQTSLLDVISDMETISRKKLNIEFADYRAGDIKNSFADVSKINNYSFMKHTPLMQGLRQYVNSVH